MQEATLDYAVIYYATCSSILKGEQEIWEGGCKDGTGLPHSLFAAWPPSTWPILKHDLQQPGHDLT